MASCSASLVRLRSNSSPSKYFADIPIDLRFRVPDSEKKNRIEINMKNQKYIGYGEKEKTSITKSADCPITFRFGDSPSKILSDVDG